MTFRALEAPFPCLRPLSGEGGLFHASEAERAFNIEPCPIADPHHLHVRQSLGQRREVANVSENVVGGGAQEILGTGGHFPAVAVIDVATHEAFHFVVAHDHSSAAPLA